MSMNLEATHPEAFALVTDALEYVDRYRESRNIAALRVAKAKLGSAKDRDPQYFRAHYVDAIVDDLSGHPKRAVETFSRLLDEHPSALRPGAPSMRRRPGWPLIAEVRYNLALAWYHQYHHQALDRAIEYFTAAASSSTDLSLRLLARAGLAQAHAMHLIPKLPDRPDHREMQRHLDLAVGLAAEVLGELPNVRRRRIPPARLGGTHASVSEINWTALNARGMALMYGSDYLPPQGAPGWQADRTRSLRQAIEQFERADRASPHNWANYCDRASATMRLAYYQQSAALFQAAIALLRTVIETLRPGYGFALYEIGRAYRLSGQFDAATMSFNRALAIPADDRDVSDRRLHIELARAERRQTEFP
jgi:tetratricopeptide (TPR) repeat protein